MSFLSTHVLDVTGGRPAEGVEVELLAVTPEGEQSLARGSTDTDGRVTALGPDALPGGDYRLRFAVGTYFDRHGLRTLFPTIAIDFLVTEGESAHLHLPVLVSPYAYSTYRGS